MKSRRICGRVAHRGTPSPIWCDSALENLVSLSARMKMHLRSGPTAGKGCALRCSRRSSADTVSYSATCWKSPTPASFFKQDTDERSATVMLFSPERKEPSRAGCYASLQSATALGSVPHPPREGFGKRHGPAAPERGLSVSHGLPLTPSLPVHETLPWLRDLSERTLPTAGWADVGRQRDPAFSLFPSSHPRPRASRARPRSPGSPRGVG